MPWVGDARLAGEWPRPADQERRPQGGGLHTVLRDGRSGYTKGVASCCHDTQAIAAEARRAVSPRLEFHPERNPYGPQVALVFEPLARLPFLPSLVVFSLLSLCAYVAAVWLFWRQAPGLAGDGCTWRSLPPRAQRCSLRSGLARLARLRCSPQRSRWQHSARGRRFLAGVCLGLLAYQAATAGHRVADAAARARLALFRGIAAIVAAQVGIAWAIVGPGAMQQYVQTLGRLAVRPDLLVLYPENAHSFRGFLRLLGVQPAAATAADAVAILAFAPLLARTWRTAATPLMKVSLLVLLTLLLTPHLLTYDLVLLALPMLALAEWTARYAGDAAARRLIVLVVALYVAAVFAAACRARAPADVHDHHGGGCVGVVGGSAEARRVARPC